jgi:hypothetical protein
LKDRTVLSSFLVTNTADSGPGSLRQAIVDSNAATGETNTIDFHIPGNGVQTIAPASPLPAITQAVLIDGFSQPGYSNTPLIMINPASSGTVDGLTIAGSDVTVRGLANGGFALGTGNVSGELMLQSGLLQASDSGNAGRVDTYRIDTSGDGRLFMKLNSRGVTTRLSLLDAQGRALVESDGISSTDPNGQIDQHIPAGTYFLEVVTSGSTGDWVLTATLTPASPPFESINVEVSDFGRPYLAVGDFNGDGIPDLATADGVHLGVGDGTFREPSVGLGLSAGNPDLIGMVSGDFNGDGQLDLVVEGWDSGAVSVLLGKGDGSFQLPKLYSVGTSDQIQYPAGSILVAGDFNGDGHLDLAVANEGSYPNYGDTVAVLLGNGDGTFQPQVTYAVGSYPDAIVAGDFTGDGRLDLATANWGSNDVSVLLGNGDGTFQPAVEYTVGQNPDALVGQNPDALVAGDFNGDGRLDLAVADAGNGSLGGVGSILLGNGDGTFQAPKTFAGEQHALVAGDFNGDGRLDLAATYVDSVSVLVGNGDGTFQAPEEYAAGLHPWALAAGDFNGDGRLDLAVADLGAPQLIGSGVSILLGNGDGTFPELQPGAVERPRSVVAADFNGDGRLDLATANSISDNISVLLGNGDGTYRPEQRFATGQLPSSPVAGDFNGDGRPDLATVNLDSNDISVLLGNGDGTFQPAVQYAVGSGPDAIVAGDFNGDGKLDLAVANSGDNTVSILLGNGDGTFRTQVTYAVGSSPDAIVAGDFNGDGHLDLVMVDSGNQGTDPAGVIVLLGNGDGTFQVPRFFAAPGVGQFWPYPLVAGDFNGDGRLDLAMLTYPSTGISVLLGNGDGTFQAPEEYGTGLLRSTFALTAGDFNGGWTARPRLHVQRDLR